jgi:hypothetical protein
MSLSCADAAAAKASISDETPIKPDLFINVLLSGDRL